MMRITIFCVFLVFGEVYVVIPPGDLVGKLNVGYQGWFTCAGDNSPVNTWFEWTNNVLPSPGHQTFELWPDVTEFNKTYQTGYANLGNGQKATLFSSYDDQTVQVHFEWITTYGIDGVALERFGANFRDPRIIPYVNGLTNKVMLNAEKTNKKFYITWDISGWINFNTEIKTDFTNYVSAFTKSPAYAKQNGKPVVGVWGIGVTNRIGTPSQGLDVISFLKSNGLYVIGGVSNDWFTGGQGSQPGFLDVYNNFDMISPWSVGAFGAGVVGANAYQSILAADLAHCNANNIDYQPVLWPGFAWSNWHPQPGNPPNAYPRLHGDFMWQQFVNLRQLAIKNAYVAMFDEFNEATAIAKAAETTANIPTNQYFERV